MSSSCRHSLRTCMVLELPRPGCRPSAPNTVHTTASHRVVCCTTHPSPCHTLEECVQGQGGCRGVCYDLHHLVGSAGQGQGGHAHLSHLRVNQSTQGCTMVSMVTGPTLLKISFVLDGCKSRTCICQPADTPPDTLVQTPCMPVDVVDLVAALLLLLLLLCRMLLVLMLMRLPVEARPAACTAAAPTWERRMAPDFFRGGNPKASGPSMTMLPADSPSRSRVFRPPGRTMV
jgi:hypothetical protein